MLSSATGRTLTKVSIYDVQVNREGRWWIVAVPAVGSVTQARRFAEVEAMVRELIEVTTGDVDVVLRVSVEQVGGVEVGERLAQIRREREEAVRLERKASVEVRALAQDLVAQEIPLRDVGAVLGISHQRAHQLVSSPAS